MKKHILNLLIIFPLLTIIHQFSFASNSYLEATDFNAGELKQIALAILENPKVAGGEGPLTIKVGMHSGLDAQNSGKFNNSYFQLVNHSEQIYRILLTDVINNGTVVTGQENTAIKFSILWEIPLNSLGGLGNNNPYGVKNPGIIGRHISGGGVVKNVRKVKVVFSVINLKQSDKISGMPHVINKLKTQDAGGLITFFPVPSNFTH